MQTNTPNKISWFHNALPTVNNSMLITGTAIQGKLTASDETLLELLTNKLDELKKIRIENTTLRAELNQLKSTIKKLVE